MEKRDAISIEVEANTRRLEAVLNALIIHDQVLYLLNGIHLFVHSGSFSLLIASTLVLLA